MNPRFRHAASGLRTYLWFVACLAIASCARYGQSFDPTHVGLRELFKSARKDIHPQQVRESPVLLGDQTIAWVGILLDAKPIETPRGPAVAILVDHHYFDWTENYGPHTELYFLSPRGEGQFTVILSTEKLLTTGNVQIKFPIGMMIVATGVARIPTSNENFASPYLLASGLAGRDRRLYRLDVYDYGREGEPVTPVKVSQYWKLFGTK